MAVCRRGARDVPAPQPGCKDAQESHIIVIRAHAYLPQRPKHSIYQNYDFVKTSISD